jgi:hypothetical protein
MIPHFARP